MKKKRGRKIKIKFSNRWLYTFIVLGILAIVAVGVYAWPASGAGHNANEIDFSNIGSRVIPTSAVDFRNTISSKDFHVTGRSFEFGSDSSATRGLGVDNGASTAWLLLTLENNNGVQFQVQGNGDTYVGNDLNVLSGWLSAYAIRSNHYYDDASSGNMYLGEYNTNVVIRGSLGIDTYSPVKLEDGCTDDEAGQIKKCSQTAYGVTLYYTCICSRTPSAFGPPKWHSLV